jgi:hypothetical protein
MYAMNETCCTAYSYVSTIEMEHFLYDDDYSMYNEDADGDHQLDNLIWYQLFGCGGFIP